MQRKINYSKSGSSQFVYELPGNKEDSDLFVSFRKVNKRKIDLLKSCKLILSDPSLNDMTESNLIYLDTITNKQTQTLKKQTKFLLAPILPKLKEQSIKYILLFPSVLEVYTKKYGTLEGLNQIGIEFKELGYNNTKLVEKLLSQRNQLAKYYEKLGFKSYDPCPGFIQVKDNDENEDNWQLKIPVIDRIQYGIPKDITFENGIEFIQYIHPDSKKLNVLKLPSQYWMIAKVDDVYKILFTECIKERITKFKEMGVRDLSNINEKISLLKLKIETIDKQNKLINQLHQQIDILSLDNFNVEFKKLNQMIDLNKLEIDELKEYMVDLEFSKDLTDLIEFGQKLSSSSNDGLAKCLNMTKEFEDKDIWILNGGSSTGYYLNLSNNYKKLYLKYKTKYLNSKNN